MIPGAYFGHLITLHGLIVMIGLAVYVASSHTLHLRRHPSAAIAWVVALVLMPYAALPLYLMFGSRKVAGIGLAAKTKQLPWATSPASTANRIQQLAAAMALPPIANYRRLNIHDNGAAALQSLRDLINGATRSIDLCTFLFARDSLGDEISELLRRRAQSGIKVRVLVDGIGAYLGGLRSYKALTAAGVDVVFFVPPLRSTLRGRTNLRNHRKMVIVDNQQLWCGGRNLATEYFEGSALSQPVRQAWVDLSFDLHGPVAKQAQQQFDQDWNFATRGEPLEHGPAIEQSLSAELPTAQLIPSGPDQADDTLYTLLVSSFFVAKKSISLVTPYFVPDPTLLMSLTLAARRGISVDLLLPSTSNHRLADLARHRALRELTAAGARIGLLPQMIHAKAIVIDEELALVGSANLDERSLFLNYELMVAFYEPADVLRFARWVDCQRHKATPYVSKRTTFWREIAEGLLLWLAFQL